MTSLPRLSAFTDNPVTRAERTYQQRSSKPPRPWLRWLNRIILWTFTTISFILFGGLLVGALLLRDPTLIVQRLAPLPGLLMIVTVYFHIVLMLQTITMTANSISREREAQTWDMLVLTGIDARQIVRGKWWASVQRQFPRYLVLGLLRAGANVALTIGIGVVFYQNTNYYTSQIQLPHPLTTLISALFGMGFTLANLGFSAACGVMASATSRRSTIAIARGIVNQIVLSVVSAVAISILVSRVLLSSGFTNPWQSIVLGIVYQSSVSLVDNGITLLAGPLYVEQIFNTQDSYSPIAPFAVDWIIAACIGLLLYALLIWFALWRAEKRAVAEMATPAS